MSAYDEAAFPGNDSLSRLTPVRVFCRSSQSAAATKSILQDHQRSAGRKARDQQGHRDRAPAQGMRHGSSPRSLQLLTADAALSLNSFFAAAEALPAGSGTGGGRSTLAPAAGYVPGHVCDGSPRFSENISIRDTGPVGLGDIARACCSRSSSPEQPSSKVGMPGLPVGPDACGLPQ